MTTHTHHPVAAGAVIGESAGEAAFPLGDLHLVDHRTENTPGHLCGNMDRERAVVELPGRVQRQRVSCRRQRDLQRWVNRAMDLEQDGTDLVLTGQSAAGELLATPELSRLDLAVCLVDVADGVRSQRLEQRDSGTWSSSAKREFNNWARWHREHARDPGHHPEVITDAGASSWCWDRWQRWDRHDPRWNVSVIDSTDCSINDAATAIGAWVKESRARRDTGHRPLYRGCGTPSPRPAPPGFSDSEVATGQAMAWNDFGRGPDTATRRSGAGAVPSRDADAWSRPGPRVASSLSPRRSPVRHNPGKVSAMAVISDSPGVTFYSDLAVDWPNFYPPGVRPDRTVSALDYVGDRSLLSGDEKSVAAWLCATLDMGQPLGPWLPAYGVRAQRRHRNKVHQHRGFWAVNDSDFATRGRVSETALEVGGELVLGGVQELPTIDAVVDDLVRRGRGSGGLFVLGATEALAMDFLSEQLRSPNWHRQPDYSVRYGLPEATIIAAANGCLIVRLWRVDEISLNIFGAPDLVARFGGIRGRSSAHG